MTVVGASSAGAWSDCGSAGVAPPPNRRITPWRKPVALGMSGTASATVSAASDTDAAADAMADLACATNRS